MLEIANKAFTKTIAKSSNCLRVNPVQKSSSPSAPRQHYKTRMSELLDRNKSATLSRSEEVEFDRYLLLEHWVRLAKAHAYKNLQTAA